LPVVVEFCSASSQGSRGKEKADKKKTEEEGRIAVKPKSADDYVGRPNQQ